MIASPGWTDGITYPPPLFQPKRKRTWFVLSPSVLHTQSDQVQIPSKWDLSNRGCAICNLLHLTHLGRYIDPRRGKRPPRAGNRTRHEINNSVSLTADESEKSGEGGKGDPWWVSGARIRSPFGKTHRFGFRRAPGDELIRRAVRSLRTWGTQGCPTCFPTIVSRVSSSSTSRPSSFSLPSGFRPSQQQPAIGGEGEAKPRSRL